MIQTCQESIAQIARLAIYVRGARNRRARGHRPLDFLVDCFDGLFFGLEDFGGGFFGWELIEDELTAARAGLDQKTVGELGMARGDQFGQSQIVGVWICVGPRKFGPEKFRLGKLGSGVHRGAKAGARCRGALDSDDEEAFASQRVLRVDEGWGHQDTVLDGDCGQFAGA